MEYELHHGDCLEVMAGMDAGSVDAVVTDPPYGLGFMGKAWDGIPPGPDTAAAMLRVLRPSSYLLAFGGTRTWHRLACALEDAGFEIRDTLMWLYGSGFPKGKACLKPAWEPVILARKPGPMRELGIEECRVAATPEPLCVRRKSQAVEVGIYSPGERPAGELASCKPEGRWPANLILDEASAAMVDGQSGASSSSSSYRPPDAGGSGNVYLVPHPEGGFRGHDDSGGASRFFYCAKASRGERNEGCEGMEAKASPCAVGMPVVTASSWGDPEQKQYELTTAHRNHHPTVKPVDLMRWLVRLVARPGDLVLDPFLGSGTTGVACVEEQRRFVGVEREAEYVAIAEARIGAAAAQLRLPV